MRKKQPKNKKKLSQVIPKQKYKPEEWEWPIPAYKNGKKWEREKRVAYIKELFKRGILDPRRQELAELMGVDRRTLFNDFQKVYSDGLDPDEVERTKVQLGNALKNAIIETSNLVVETKKNPRDKLMAVKTLSEVSERYVNFLEKFDIKTPGKIDEQKPIVIRWLGEGEELE